MSTQRRPRWETVVALILLVVGILGAAAMLCGDRFGQEFDRVLALLSSSTSTLIPTGANTPEPTSAPTNATVSAPNTSTSVPTDSPTLTNTPSPTHTLTPSPADTPTSTNMPSPTHTLTPSPTDTPTSTNTPTTMPTDTPTSTQTYTPSPTSTLMSTPTRTPAPINTPTPTRAPPIPTVPPNDIHPRIKHGVMVRLEWTWAGDLGSDGMYSVRVWHQEGGSCDNPCFHHRTSETVYLFDPESEECSGKYNFCWEVQPVRPNADWPHGWEPLSDPSETWCFGVCSNPICSNKYQ